MAIREIGELGIRSGAERSGTERNKNNKNKNKGKMRYHHRKSVLQETVQGLRKSHMRHMGQNGTEGHILGATLARLSKF